METLRRETDPVGGKGGREDGGEGGRCTGGVEHKNVPTVRVPASLQMSPWDRKTLDHEGHSLLLQSYI